MNLKPLVKPILNNLPFLYDTFGLGTGGSTTAPYCYSVWLRHLVRAHEKGFEIPRVVAELGPGDSLGVGLAALLTGAKEYYALDIKEYANAERNVEILNNLAHLFDDRMMVPDDKELPLVNPKLSNYEFPGDIITDLQLKKNLSRERIEVIKKIVQEAEKSDEEGIRLKYFVPWDSGKVVKAHSVDMIIAQAVMEHVRDLQKTYQAIYSWLKPGGLLSQDIDFKSHNLAFKWNGHWAKNDLSWKFVIGRREWVINREPLSRHLDIMKRVGFEILTVERTRHDKGIRRASLAGEFKDMSDEDLETSQAFVQARKK